jgi:transcriptional regulator with XRE-family HTH domain
MRKPTPWRTLGDLLATARQDRWLTQLQVAKRSGMSQPAYSQIERGLVRPRPRHLLRLALVLGIALDVLAAPASYSVERLLVSGVSGQQSGSVP